MKPANRKQGLKKIKEKINSSLEATFFAHMNLDAETTGGSNTSISTDFLLKMTEQFETKLNLALLQLGKYHWRMVTILR